MNGESRRFVKTHLGEGEVVCDRCNCLAKKEECTEIRSPLSNHIYHVHKKGCASEGKVDESR